MGRRLCALAPVVLLAAALAWPAGEAPAQDRARTLADIRQDLTVLNVEIQRLRRELSTTGGPQVQPGGSGVLDRVNAIEGELQRLTARTEELDYRISRIVEDGTNRIGELEFRLVELEGGDVSQLGETTTLGGEAPAPAPAPDVPPAGGQDGPQLAVGEREDFERAQTAMEEGDHASAEAIFAEFREAYPGSPMEPQVMLGHGRALEALGDTRAAAQVYLDGFSAHPEADTAPETLFRLGSALGELDRAQAACQILADLGNRYPGSDFVERAQARMGELACQ